MWNPIPMNTFRRLTLVQPELAEPQWGYLKKTVSEITKNPINSEIPLKQRLAIGDNKWIWTLWFFNGDYDKEEDLNKVGKKKWMNQVDWNTKHFATPLDTLFKD